MKQPIRKARSFKNYSKEQLLVLLDMPKLNELLMSICPNHVTDILVEEITRILNILAPIKTIQIRNHYAVYLTNATKELMAKRDNMKQLAHISKNEDDFVNYKRIRNNVTKAQRQDKAEWARALITKEGNTSKHLWQAVKRISGDDAKKAINCLKVKDILITNKEEISNTLNSHFVNKVKNLISDMPNPTEDILKSLKNTPTPQGGEMALMSLTESELNIIIKRMKKTAAAGYDEISGKVLNDLYGSIKRILLHAINLSLASGTYPDIFKITKLIPLLKKGKDPLQAASYRPISNLCSLGKIFEEAFFNQTSKHINMSGLINKDQHGGRGAHSTTSCLTELWEEAKKATENKDKASITAIDLSAAYDLCCHSLLLEKCRLLKIGKNATNCLHSFLENRKRYVELDGSKSSILETGPFGVVQGGRSSGELFLYFLNDLPLQLSIKTSPEDPANSIGKEFVDDMSILTIAKTIPILLKQVVNDYKKVQRFLINHKMCINTSKTQFMLLLPPKDTSDIKIELDNITISHQHSIKVLGVTLSDTMKFDNHIWSGKESMARNLNSKTALLKTIKPYLSTVQLGQIGANLINSTILYAAPLWGATTKENIARVQSIQIKAARVIKNKAWARTKHKQHRQELLDELKWPNTQQIINSATLNLAKKATTASSSEGLNNLFKVSKATHTRKLPVIRIDHRGKVTSTNNIFSVNAPKLFNNLPAELKDPNMSNTKFKRQLKHVTIANNRLTAHFN